MSMPSLQSEIALEAEAATRRGLSHEINQDAYLVDVEGGLFAVADGMGGHRDGHAASSAIISILQRTLDLETPFEQRVENATRAIEGINASLFAQSQAAPDLDISGSTIVSLLVAEGYACCLWVGDSRLYLFRDDELYLVSEDHVAADGVLTRAVGSAAAVEVERRVFEVAEGDVLLLCSDGLLKGVDEAGIGEILGFSGEAPADRLLAKSIAGGTTDDITVLIVWVGRED